MARKYQHTRALLPQIRELLAQGMSQKQVEQILGLTGTRPVHELLKRERRRDASHALPQRGRLAAGTLQEYKAENRQLRMENELLAGFSAVRRKEVRPKVKYQIIYRHRKEYRVSVLCRFFSVSRSGYYGFVRRLNRPEADAELGRLIQTQQQLCRHTYGYRRMWIWLKKQGICRNPKTVLRMMRKYGALAEIRRSRKWVQLGQQVHKYENLLNRDFKADRPNAKWVTDISYIHTGQGVLYLSIIRDLYDNRIVAYKMAETQTVSLVLDTIRAAMKQEKPKAPAALQLHSDQGFQYTSQAYFNLTKEYGILPSMSRRGNCYDNAMAENFFSILKTECIYRQKIRSFQQARELIDGFIYFYNHERIQSKTGAAPLSLCPSTI